MDKIWRFIKDEDGLELSEYAVIGGIVIGAGVAVYLLLGTAIQGAMTTITAAITT
jgi:Flp pilus assembly pilin Flp